MGLLIALGLVCVHVAGSQLPATRYLDGRRLDYLASTQWLGFSADLFYASLFFFSLPLLAGLGPGLAAVEDSQSQFVRQLVVPGLAKYVFRNIAVTFGVGVLTSVLPLLLDYGFACVLFPRIVPNLALNNEMLVQARLTYGAAYFYRQPLVIVALYLGVNGLLSGLYALFGLLMGLIWRNQYIAVSAPFLSALLLTIGAGALPGKIYSPIYVAIPFSPEYLPPLGWLLASVVLMLFLTAGGIAYEINQQAVV